MDNNNKLLGFITLTSFLGVFVSGFLRNNPLMYTLLLILIIALTFLFLDKFKDFDISVKGIKATIKEAESTISEIKLLAKALSKTQLATISRMGKAFGMGSSKEQREYLKEEINKTLLEIGISKEEIKNEVLPIWNELVKYDYYAYIYGDIYNLLQPRGSNPEANDAFCGSFILGGIETIKSSSELMKFYTDFKLNMKKSIKETLNDYSHFEKTCMYLSKERWMKIP